MASTCDSLAQQYQSVRKFTNRIVAPLSPEDCMVQSMPDSSPMRWHLAHTTWFFETFILESELNPTDYAVFDPQFSYLFNSYYNSVGDQFPRPQRGLISRPGLDQIKNYRAHVDRFMLEFLAAGVPQELQYAIQVGLNHEQQHQELMLTDIKHALSANPTLPQYESAPFAPSFAPSSLQPAEKWFSFDEGVYQVGHRDDSEFAFDNESPRHRVFLHAFSIAGSAVTSGQYLEFMQAGGYQRPEYWLSIGWAAVQDNNWNAPLYWVEQDDRWMQFTHAGLVPVDPNWPVCHVSYFEADAFARWAGKRLPTEFEWEVAAESGDDTAADQFADVLIGSGMAVHPTGGGQAENHPGQMFGGVWEWTSSSYSAYPGYAPPEGALGEYNGKFMCNQYVLRGGSVATSRDHIRASYRNFFPPHARWQFMGIRLAK